MVGVPAIDPAGHVLTLNYYVVNEAVRWELGTGLPPLHSAIVWYGYDSCMKENYFQWMLHVVNVHAIET